MKPLHRLVGRDIGRGPEGGQQGKKERAARQARKATLATLNERLSGLKSKHSAPGFELNGRGGNKHGQAPGLGAIDACFNAGGLPMAAVHEVWTDATLEHPSAAGFALALGCHLAHAQQGAHGARAGGDLVWIYPRRSAREWGLPYGPGLMAFGLDPGRLILVETRSAIEALWAGEEALRAVSPSSVVIALDRTYGAHAFIASRRLALAARARRASAFLLCPGVHAPASAASLRWRIAPAREQRTP